jgi:hypothetical protein
MSVNTDQKIIKNKVGLLNVANMLGSVSEACKVMGYSRDRTVSRTRPSYEWAEGNSTFQSCAICSRV